MEVPSSADIEFFDEDVRADLQTFRKSLEDCTDPHEKLLICDQKVDRLRHEADLATTRVVLFRDLIRKEYGHYLTTQDAQRAQRWKEFDGLADSGASMINRKLPSLRMVAETWGAHRVRHYRWANCGLGFCQALALACRTTPDWNEATVKVNQLLMYRIEHHPRRPIRDDVNTIELADLQHLKNWGGTGSFSPSIDRGPLLFRALSVLHISYGYDGFGLLVLNHRQERSDPIYVPPEDIEVILTDQRPSSSASERQSSPPTRHEGLSQSASTESVTSYSTRLSVETATDKETVAREPTTGQIIDPAEQSPGLNRPVHRERTASRRGFHAHIDAGSDQNETGTDDEDIGPSTVASKLRPRTQPNYKPQQGVSRGAGRVRKFCCPRSLKPLVAMLDSSSSDAKVLSAIQVYEGQERAMCRNHLLKLAQLYRRTNQSAHTGKQFIAFESSKRRASLPDLGGSLREIKSPRVDLSPDRALLGTLARRDEDEAEVKTLRSSLGKPQSEGTHGENARQYVHKLLCKAIPPKTEGDEVDAHVCSKESASQLMQKGYLDVPVITDNQQSFKWDKCSRPIVQLFERMDQGMYDAELSVQIPSRSANSPSCKRMTFSEVQDRFLANKTRNDPWNILDCRAPLPSCLFPEFLTGSDYQLLGRVRDWVLGRGALDRISATRDDWKFWKEIESWILLAEGGSTTPPHMDSHGFCTWLTVQEGPFVFGWLSQPSEGELKEWKSNPGGYTGGKWRVVVLRAGETIYFPSGTIHFVSRMYGKQTFAVGGHVLQWSGIVQCMQVMLDQYRDDQITNETMEDAVLYVQAINALVGHARVKGKIDMLGGLEAVMAFEKFVEDFGRIQAARS